MDQILPRFNFFLSFSPIDVYKNTNQEDSWRHLALEVVVTLCETAPAMVRKVAGAKLETAIRAMLEMMTG